MLNRGSDCRGGSKKSNAPAAIAMIDFAHSSVDPPSTGARIVTKTIAAGRILFWRSKGIRKRSFGFYRIPLSHRHWTLVIPPAATSTSNGPQRRIGFAPLTEIL